MRLSRSLAAALAAALGLLPVAPPEHVHEAEEPGHAHVVVHRHATTHGILELHSPRHSTAAVEDDDHDGPAFTLTESYTVPATTILAAAPPNAGALLEPPAPGRTERAIAAADVLIHGPPRAPTGLRGPPFFPAS